MADNNSFEYNINAEDIVNDLLADDSHTEDPIKFQEEQPLVTIICCHQPQEVFCIGCLSENCFLCTFNYHLDHPTVPLEDAFFRANYVRETLTVEANNVIFDIDNMGKHIQDEIANLLRGSFDACLEVAENIKRSQHLPNFEKDTLYINIVKATQSQESFLRDELSELYEARERAIQTAYFLGTELAFSVSNQLAINDKALSELSQCRSVINKVFNTYELFTINDETFTDNNQSYPEQNLEGIDHLTPLFHFNSETVPFTPYNPIILSNEVVITYNNCFLIGLPVLPLHQVFDEQKLALEQAGTSSSGYGSASNSDTESSSSSSPVPEVAKMHREESF